MTSSTPPSTQPLVQNYPALESITAAATFAQAIKHRPWVRSAHFALYLTRTVDSARLGLIVPKRWVRLANDRNRVKRVVREVFRLHQHTLGRAEWIVRLMKAPVWINQPVGLFKRHCRLEIETLLAEALKKF